MTESEYLAYDLASDRKHEFVNGDVRAVAGISEAHSTLHANLVAALHARLRGGPCRVHGSDLRVTVTETGAYAYPDLTVVCGKAELSETRPPSLRNPTVVVEVLSESTEGYDLGSKAAHYRHRESVLALVFVDSRRQWMQLQIRNGDGTWTLSEQASGVISLPSIGVELPLSELYEGVVFDGS